ncbi:MAG: IS630 family transposase [Proteobacteria bacterium]|nr:IS630 family transposase [Pseudomonadota bacterium]
MLRRRAPLKKLRRAVRQEVWRQAERGRRVRLMFQDEGRFGLLGTPRRCWAPRGVRPVVGARLQRQYLYAFSAVSPHDGVLDSLVLPWVNAEAMSLFLAEVAQRHADEFILMVMDQAGWHIAGDLEVPPNMRLMFLPAYSPELNPAEHLWKAIREDCFANHVLADLDAVEAVLTNGLAALEANPSRTQSMTGFK